MKTLAPMILLYTCIALSAPTVSLKDANGILLKDNPSVLILGADHVNSGLSVAIIDLLSAVQSQKNFNCLFLELPSDIQEQLDRAVELDSLRVFSKAFLDSKINATTAAYIRLGHQRTFEKVREAFAAHYDDPIVNNSVSAGLLSFLKLNDIRAIAFDAPSSSKEFLEASYYSVADQTQGRSLERDMQSMKISNQRSQIMSQTIQERFKSFGCNQAVVVVGYAHLFSDDYFNKIYPAETTLTPLQKLLNEAGIKGSVLLSEKIMGLSHSSLNISDDQENRFPLYIGKLLNP